MPRSLAILTVVVLPALAAPVTAQSRYGPPLSRPSAGR